LSIVIHTKDLVKTYRTRTVVNHVSVEVKQGEIVGLLGPNGAGKTTTFYMVVGLIRPDEGTVFLNDEDITRQPMYKRAQMGIGYLPQETSVFRKLSVEDNIRAVLEMTKLSKAEQRDKLEALLDEFNLHRVRKNNGDSLSGGERRRTEIARALAVDPKFILLDEPFAGVDPIAVEDIQTVVARLKYRNIGILITDHNVNETLSICDRAYLLIEGKIFKHGTAEQLAEDEQVRRLYLGRNFELKRKDYLHEEARAGENRDIDGDKLVAVLENGLQWTQQALNDLTRSEKIITADSKNFLDLPAYFNFIAEIKESTIAYAQQHRRVKLMEMAIAIPGYKPADFFRQPVIAALSDEYLGTSTNYNYPQLTDALHDLDAKLKKLQLWVQNEEFEQI
jgi:lipopolysaccharide export system ATP-binding protein